MIRLLHKSKINRVAKNRYFEFKKKSEWVLECKARPLCHGLWDTPEINKFDRNSASYIEKHRDARF